MATMMQWITILFAAQLFLMWTASEARSITKPATLWKLDDGNTEDYYKWHGAKHDSWLRTVVKLNELKMLIVKHQAGVSFDMSALNNTEPALIDRLENCTIVVEEQAEEMVADELAHTQGSRKKRTIDNSAFLRWEMPIHWKFDGNHTETERQIVRKSFAIWEEATCARFQELGTHEAFQDNHVLITREEQGCYSFVGRVNVIPQQLNLQSGCLNEIGTPVHEIGHVLGLWHEQQRSDRDDSIRVLWDNVGSMAGQFYMRRTDNHGVPYNVASVMHYGPKSGSKNGRNTMEAIDEEYQPNMGQRVELTFTDAKIINLAYCTQTCTSALPRSCKRSGYQDPNDCSKCRCPFGFSGTYCESVAPPVNAQCGGDIQATYTPTIIKTPGYDDPKYYENRIQCNWLIKAPANHNVVLKFEDEFGAYCHNDNQCYHWIELRHGKEIGVQGPRHCCYIRPSDATTSATDEMLVTFKSNWDVPWTTAKRGFKASIVAEPMPGYARLTTSPNQSTRPTTTTLASSTTDCKKTDLAFVVDSSASVNADTWTKMTSFMSRFVADQSPTGHDGCLRVSVVTFGDKPKMHFELRAHDSIADLQALLGDVSRNRHTTDIGGGLEVARTGVFQSNGGDRVGARDVCILITDGQSAADDKSNAATKARDIRQAGIEVYAVGVGSGVDQNELNDLTGNSDRVMLLDRTDLLTDQSSLSRLEAIVFPFAETTTTPSPTSSSSHWSCSFEDNSGDKTMCDMSQSTSDTFDWTLQSGKTPSGETGPEKAYNGNYYVFIETSNPRQFGDKAELYAPSLGSSGKHCVRFNYNMYGFHIHKLQVVKKRSSGEVIELWYRSNDLGNTWWSAAVSVEINATDRIGFVGIRGNEYSGDIALDNISIQPGEC